jgi:hypothetical protein
LTTVNDGCTVQIASQTDNDKRKGKAVDINEQLTVQEAMEQRAADYAAGLRELADYLEAHPELVPSWGGVAVADWVDTAKLAKAARLPGWTKAKDTYSGLKLTRSFGDHKISLYPEQAVCEKVKTGERTEEVIDPEYLANAPKITKVVEEFEWKCPDYISQIDSGEAS